MRNTTIKTTLLCTPNNENKVMAILPLTNTSESANEGIIEESKYTKKIRDKLSK
jgi:hypothetical protein